MISWLQDLEERERNFYASQGRNEITIQGLQHDVKYHEERVRECEKKIRQLEHNMSEEVQLKERARLNLQVQLSADCPTCVLFQYSRSQNPIRFFSPWSLPDES
jgi:hypothetical protein